MKIITALSSAILAATIATSAMAGGHYAPQIATAATAKTLPDDTRITIRGTIIRALGDERYELQDSTGKIIVEIDHEDAPAGIIGKTITITGDVDVKAGGRVSIDADRIQLR